MRSVVVYNNDTDEQTELEIDAAMLWAREKGEIIHRFDLGRDENLPRPAPKNARRAAFFRLTASATYVRFLFRTAAAWKSMPSLRLRADVPRPVLFLSRIASVRAVVSATRRSGV